MTDKFDWEDEDIEFLDSGDASSPEPTAAGVPVAVTAPTVLEPVSAAVGLKKVDLGAQTPSPQVGTGEGAADASCQPASGKTEGFPGGSPVGSAAPDLKRLIIVKKAGRLVAQPKERTNG